MGVPIRPIRAEVGIVVPEDGQKSAHWIVLLKTTIKKRIFEINVCLLNKAISLFDIA